MKRHQAEHILRAAGAILDGRERHFCVIGSQAILAAHPSPPTPLSLSMELDIYPMTLPKEDASVVDAVLGEGSSFHDAFGYYADGVSHSAPTLPQGWRDRLTPLQSERTEGVTGWCLELHDLAVSKYIAGRPKDLDYNRALARHKFVKKETLLQRLAQTDCGEDVRQRVIFQINKAFPLEAEQSAPQHAQHDAVGDQTPKPP